jgi:hypothetical protein
MAFRRDRPVASRPIPSFKGLDIWKYHEFPTLLLLIWRARRGAGAPDSSDFRILCSRHRTGGSTRSELLMGVPVSWVHHRTNIAVCLVVALVTWTTPLACWPNSAIDWFDAAPIEAYAAVAAMVIPRLCRLRSWGGLPPVSAAYSAMSLPENLIMNWAAETTR